MLDQDLVTQLRVRIERLEATRPTWQAASVHRAPELWLVQTRKHPDDSYPEDWDDNVFPCVAIERVFDPDDTAPQALDDSPLCLEDDDEAPPGWPRVHCPWYVPPGFTFHAWCDPTQRLFHAIDPPRSLFAVTPAAGGGISGATADSSSPSIFTLGYGDVHIYVSGEDGTVEKKTIKDSEEVEQPVVMRAWNLSPVGVRASDTRLLHLHVEDRDARNLGKWFVDFEPCG